jgi:outer membrane protein
MLQNATPRANDRPHRHCSRKVVVSAVVIGKVVGGFSGVHYQIRTLFRKREAVCAAFADFYTYFRASKLAVVLPSRPLRRSSLPWALRCTGTVILKLPTLRLLVFIFSTPVLFNWLTIPLVVLLVAAAPSAAAQAPVPSQAQPPVPAQARYTLRECLDMALQTNLQVRLAQTQLGTSQANLLQTKAAFVPSLNGSVNAQQQYGTSFDFLAFQRVNQATRLSQPQLSLSTDVFNGFAKHYALRQAEANLEADRQGLQNTRENLLTQVLSQFLLLLNDDAAIAQSKQREALIEQQLARVRTLRASGAATELQVLQLVGQLATENTTRIVAEANQRRDENTLVLLLQLEPTVDYVFLLGDTLLPTEANIPLPALQPTVNHAVQHMAVVRQSVYQASSASLAPRLARASLYPVLTFAAGLSSSYTSNGGVTNYTAVPFVVGFNGTTVPITDAEGNALTNNVPSGTSRTSYFNQLEDNFAQTLSLTLNVPLFNAYQARTRVQLAVVQARAADINLEITRNNLQRTVVQAFTDAEAAQARYRSLEGQLNAFTESFRLTDLQYQAGIATFVEYIEALNNRTNTELQLQQALYELVFRRRILEFYGGQELRF